jgi:hypothetical protein
MAEQQMDTPQVLWEHHLKMLRPPDVSARV